MDRNEMNFAGINLDGKLGLKMVYERRLNPIIELLDSGQSQKALTEVDKLLRKTLKYTLAKVCKALALIRLKHQVEARFILEQVMRENVQKTLADESTSHALIVCYLELREPRMICDILERISLLRPSEDVLVQLFFAHVRVEDFKKMHRTAIELYKKFEKTSYFSWAIASLVTPLVHFLGPLDYQSVLSLELAERMTDRFLLQRQITTLSSDDYVPLVDLYMQVLVRQFKWMKILDTVNHYKSAANDPMCWPFKSFYKYYSIAMDCVGRAQELFNELKIIFMKHPNEQKLLKQLVDYSPITTKIPDLDTQLDEFLGGLRIGNPGFVVAISDLYYLKISQKLTDPKFKERVIKDVEMAVEFGLEKSAFFPDMISFLKEMELKDQVEILESIRMCVVSCDLNSTCISASEDLKITNHLNYELVKRNVAGSWYTLRERLEQADHCVGKYLRITTDRTNEIVPGGCGRMGNSSSSSTVVCGTIERSDVPSVDVNSERNERSEPLHGIEELKEVDEVNLYLVIASSILISEHCKLARKVEQTAENVAVLEDLLTTAICLMEFIISKDPNNQTLTLVLANAYARMGASQEMLRLLIQSTIKDAQWDTLGYVKIPMILTSGAYQDGYSLLQHAELMYSNFRNDTEYLIACYNNNAFNKFDEFMAFREDLLNSTQCGLVSIERRLCQLMFNASTSDELLQVVDEIDAHKLIQHSVEINCVDNRDLRFIESLFNDHVNWTEMRLVTAAMDRNWYKMRTNLLSILIKVVKLGFEKEINQVEGKAMLEELDNDIKCHKDSCDGWKTMQSKGENCGLNESSFYGIFPSVHSKSFEMGCPLYLYELLKPLLELLKERILCRDQSIGWMKCIRKLEELVDYQCGALVKRIEKHLLFFREHPKIFRMESSTREGHFCTEHFAVVRIFAGVALTVANELLEEREKLKGKQKRKATLLEVAKGLGETFGRLEKCWEEFLEVLKMQPLAEWDGNTSCLVGPSNDKIKCEDICVVVGLTHENVQMRIRKSILAQLNGFVLVSRKLHGYMKSLEE